MSGTTTRPEVAIVATWVSHYRVPFYNALRERLAAAGIDLRVFYGEPDRAVSLRQDSASLAWGERVTNRFAGLGRRRVAWQPAFWRTRSADLVIAEQASRLLVNYAFLARSAVTRQRFAWWGHGANLAAESSRLGEWVKRRLIDRADVFFCYTEATARVVRDHGVDPNKLIVVQNATDTSALARDRASLDAHDLARTRAELGLRGAAILVLGSLYPARRPDFIVGLADELATTRPDATVVVVGDGPVRSELEEAAATRGNLAVLGARRGLGLARVAQACDVLAIPGVVGLGVLDGFALELPMITCDIVGHGPEIDYLSDGENGVVLPAPATPAVFAAEIVSLLDDPARLARLREQCRIAATEFTIDHMADNFAEGVVRLLQREERQ